MQQTERFSIEKSDFLNVNEVASPDGAQQISIHTQPDGVWSVLYRVKTDVGWSTLRGLQIDETGKSLLFHFDTLPIREENRKSVIEPHLRYTTPEAAKKHFSSTIINGEHGQNELETLIQAEALPQESYLEHIDFAEEIPLFVAAVRRFIESQGQDTEAMKAYLQLSFR